MVEQKLLVFAGGMVVIELVTIKDFTGGKDGLMDRSDTFAEKLMEEGASQMLAMIQGRRPQRKMEASVGFTPVASKEE